MDTPANFWPIFIGIIFLYCIARAVISGNRAWLVAIGIAGMIAVILSFVIAA